MIFSGKKVGAKLRQCKISHFPRENKNRARHRPGRAVAPLSGSPAGSAGWVGRLAGGCSPTRSVGGVAAGGVDILGGSQVSPALSDSSGKLVR